MELASLCAFASLAGFVDSIVGGGGLIQVPALLLFLPPPLAQSVPGVFGTNKLAACCGTSMAVSQYARGVSFPWRRLSPAGAAAFLFSFLGAHTVSVLSPRILNPLIWALLALVAIYTWLRKDFGRLHAPQLRPNQEIAVGILVGAAIGFYDGFFGPGTGSFLIFIFIGVFGFDFLRASAGAKAINLGANISAILYFAWAGHIYYRFAVPMGACNLLGAAVGARLAVLKGNRFVRGFFLTIVSVMILRLGWDLIR